MGDASEAIHLHYAYAFGRWMESNSIQPVGFHPPRVWHKLHRDDESADPCQLSHSSNILFRSSVLGRRAASRVQTVSADPKQRFGGLVFSRASCSNVGYSNSN